MDENLRNLDQALGTRSTYTDARILTVGFDPERSTVSTDLIYDSVETLPLAGTKKTAQSVLGWLRGILDSQLEGQAITPADEAGDPGGAEIVTTLAVFSAARAAGIDLVALAPGQTEAVAGLDLPGYAARILGERLQAGHAVVIPRQPVRIAGMARIAWYEIDGRTGAWRGVSGDGRHAAPVEYLTEKDIMATAAGWGTSYIGSVVGTKFSFNAYDFTENRCDVFSEAYAKAAEPDLIAAIGITATTLVGALTQNPIIVMTFGAVEYLLVRGGQQQVLASLSARYQGCP